MKYTPILKLRKMEKVKMIATNSPSRKKGEKFECSKECSAIFLKNGYAKLDNGKDAKADKTKED